MTQTRFQKLILGVSGITASAIGGFILFAPHAFYASYGISLGQDPNLLSELRAPGAGLAALGVLMLAGLWRTTLQGAAVAAAFAVFIAFPVGRLVSLALDGLPSSAVLGALAIELVIAVLLGLAFWPGRAVHGAAPMQASR